MEFCGQQMAVRGLLARKMLIAKSEMSEDILVIPRTSTKRLC